MSLTPLGLAKANLDRLRARHYKAANPSLATSMRETHISDIRRRDERVRVLHLKVIEAEKEYRRMLDEAKAIPTMPQMLRAVQDGRTFTYPALTEKAIEYGYLTVVEGQYRLTALGERFAAGPQKVGA